MSSLSRAVYCQTFSRAVRCARRWRRYWVPRPGTTSPAGRLDLPRRRLPGQQARIRPHLDPQFEAATEPAQRTGEFLTPFSEQAAHPGLVAINGREPSRNRRGDRGEGLDDMVVCARNRLKLAGVREVLLQGLLAEHP